jgi:hypothetical protein
MCADLSTDEIIQLAENKEFTKFWKITKDQVEVCKDCEF